MTSPNTLDGASARVGSVIGNVASLAGLAIAVMERSSRVSPLTGTASLNVVIQLGLLCAVGYGFLWSMTERVFGWQFGAGGSGRLPAGWSAVALSASVTFPLAFVPAAYQSVTHTKVLAANHWSGMVLVGALCAGAHLLMYGTGLATKNGIRHRMMPQNEGTPYLRALVMEAIFAAVYFSATVLPYRIIVDPTGPLLDTLLGRTVLPAVAFFFGMAVFLWLKFPKSVNEEASVEVRGVLSGVVMMLCFCAGMFL